MLRGLALSALIGLGGLSGQAAAQGGMRDPLGGQFGVVEVAMTPADAAREAELMGAALTGLQPQRPGVVDTYVLAAGLWNDPVFESEASQAADILSRRFDAGGRTITLSAGSGSGQRAFPAATPNNIQAAIGKIGAVIDPNEDLVVVFLTSHGAADGSLALQEKNRMGGAMKPTHLRASLQAAGIRRKVLIVSACHSGYFIMPFSDPDTIVLTAAAADRTSFGCEPSRDWTYFGDALLNHKLRGGAPLVQAYDDSLKLISEWETRLMAEWDAAPASRKPMPKRPDPSNPQKHVGEGVAPLVARAEAYGLAVNCAGHFAFAIERAKSSRPLKGAPDAAVLQAKRTEAETAANGFAARIQRSSQDVVKAIAASAAAVQAAFPAQTLVTAERTAQCAAIPLDPG